MQVVVVLGSHGGTQMCLGRVWVVTIYNCLVTSTSREGQPDHGAGVRVSGCPTEDQGHGI